MKNWKINRFGHVSKAKENNRINSKSKAVLVANVSPFLFSTSSLAKQG